MARADISGHQSELELRGHGGASMPRSSCMRLADGPSTRCTTLSEGPFGIESQKDVEQVTLPLRRLVEKDNAADAFVIACFSDPGLQVCREATRRPVFGINECGVLTALARGDRFGIIAITAKSIAPPSALSAPDGPHRPPRGRAPARHERRRDGVRRRTLSRA